MYMSNEENLKKQKEIAEDFTTYEELFKNFDEQGLGFVNAKNIKMNQLNSKVLIKCKNIIF